MTAELERYACSETGGGEMIPWPTGEYVRFADVEAYTQAAIAAAMMGAVKPLEWAGEEAKGIGDIIYGVSLDQQSLEQGKTAWEAWYTWSHEHEYSGDPIDLGAANAKEGAMALADASHAKDVLRYLSIPTDALAALEAVKVQVRDEVLEEAAFLQDSAANWWQLELDKRVAKSNGKGMTKEVSMAGGRLAGHFAAAATIRAMKGSVQ